MPDKVKDLAARIRLCAFDVDGVLTNGLLSINERGEESKQFHVRDGQGLVLLKRAGLEIAVISARRSSVVEARMQELGIRHLYLGCENKLAALEELLRILELNASEVLYVGDDLVDLPVMSKVGLSVAVADAHPEVQRRATWVTEHQGGMGAVREVCDAILQAQNRWESLL